MKFAQRLMELLFPPRCILCGEKGYVTEDMLCTRCAREEVKRLYRHFTVKARRQRYTLACRAPERYDGAFRKTLHSLKFRDETSLAAPIAKRMYAVLDTSVPLDCIVPVPLSAKRLKKRGYNQSALLAEALSKSAGIPVRPGLKKIRENLAQHTLSAEEREKNVRAVYKGTDVEGMRVLLLDDIVTTGATARACAAALYTAGAEYVECICAGIVP